MPAKGDFEYPLDRADFTQDPGFTPLTYDRVVGIDSLFEIGWLSRGLDLSRAVCCVAVAEVRATGFLIADSVLLTCNHVLPDPGVADEARIEFNYELDWQGQPRRVTWFGLDSSLFESSPEAELDYTLVGVRGTPGADFGHIDLAQAAMAQLNGFVAVIQHSLGRPKQICLTDNRVASVGADYIDYTAASMPGSSGAPVFDKDWRVVGMHKQGGPLAQFSEADASHFVNRGVRIDRVIADLQQGDDASRLALVHLILTSMRTTVAHFMRPSQAPRNLAGLRHALQADTRFMQAFRRWLASVQPPALLAAQTEGTACAAAFMASVLPDGHESLRGAGSRAFTDPLAKGPMQAREYVLELTRATTPPDVPYGLLSGDEIDDAVQGFAWGLLNGLEYLFGGNPLDSKFPHTIWPN